MSQRASALLVASTLLSACGPYVEDVNKERGPRIEQKLAQVRAVGEALARVPFPAKDEPGALHATIALTPPKPGVNAALMYAEDFGNLDELGYVYARLDAASLIQRCSACLHGEREPWNPAQPSTTPGPIFGVLASALYDDCEKLDALFVIRTRAFARPSAARDRETTATITVSDAGVSDAGKLDGGASDAATTDGAPSTASPSPASGGARFVSYEFEGGFVDLELLVFDLASGQEVAATHFRAENSGQISGKADDAAVEADLALHVKGNLADALRTNLRGVTVVP